VKETSLSGGYGMLVGPSAGPEEIREFAGRIRKEPERYIAQPTIRLSRAPVLLDGKLVPRHIDLRAFALLGSGERIHVIPGGLTRVALKEGSLVVNSSQGGGCKDTWVLRKPAGGSGHLKEPCGAAKGEPGDERGHWDAQPEC